MVDVVPVSMQLLRLIALVFPQSYVILLSGDTGDLALQAHSEGFAPSAAAAFAHGYEGLVADAHRMPLQCVTVGLPQGDSVGTDLAALANVLGVTLKNSPTPSQSLTEPALLPQGSAQAYRTIIPALFSSPAAVQGS